jgi:predicted RNA-binding protein (TIGR00451 family)
MMIDYIFGKGISKSIEFDRCEFRFSKKTGKLKTVTEDGKIIASIRFDGSIALSIYGAQILNKSPDFIQNCVIVSPEAEDFVAKGYSVFAKHVIECGVRIKPGSDVAILNNKYDIIAVGKAILSSKMMKAFDSGVAVNIRNSSKKN